MSTTLEEVLREAQKLPPDEQRKLAQRLLEESKKTVVPSEKSVWQKISEHAADVPDEVWEQIPTDGAEQHDHYLYGSPKR